MQHIFFSDVHLGAFSEEKNRQLENSLIKLIDYCADQSIGIHILGDLFDYWMEFPDYTPPLGKKLLNRFEKFNHTVEPATFVTGNHDNWTLGHFADLGFRVEHEFRDFTIDSQKILLLHGDGLADRKMNLPRPLLHKLLRNKTFISLYRNIFSGDTGNHLMKQFSEFTRNENDLHPERLNRWAKNLLKKKHYRYLLAGHDHVPRMETNLYGTYINTGAFYRHQTVALYNNHVIQLVIWDGEKNKFKLFKNHRTEPLLQ
ncbi:MAG: metallophosphoesterase family protein [Balneolaceae bacterium]|nr:metallophosphoesterase family protein [Balneolaceae bacterium]